MRKGRTRGRRTDGEEDGEADNDGERSRRSARARDLWSGTTNFNVSITFMRDFMPSIPIKYMTRVYTSGYRVQAFGSRGSLSFSSPGALPPRRAPPSTSKLLRIKLYTQITSTLTLSHLLALSYVRSPGSSDERRRREGSRLRRNRSPPLSRVAHSRSEEITSEVEPGRCGDVKSNHQFSRDAHQSERSRQGSKIARRQRQRFR